MLEQSGTVMVQGGACLVANLSAGTALLKTGAGKIDGLVINSHTSGTVGIWDGTGNDGDAMNGVITLGESERFIPMFGGRFETGLYVEIGGTADITIYYR